MTDIFDKFRNVFISQTNSNYILNLVLNKLNNQYKEYQNVFSNSQIIERYYLILVDLQTFIYDTYFNDIYTEITSKENFNLEEILIMLNKLTINKFELFIHQDINQGVNQDTNQIINQDNAVVESQNIQERDNQKQSIERNLQRQIAEREEQNVSETKLNNIQNIKEKENVKEKENMEEKENIREKENMEEKESIKEKDRYIQYHHFFSRDATLASGRYKFPIKLKNIKGIKMSFFKLDCNIYNITESNNKFFITEKATKVPIAIPIGYYNIDNLLEKMSDVMTFNSPNKLKYDVIRNTDKNKVYIACSSYDNNIVKFNLEFVKNDNDFSLALREILGFNKNEYINNNLYVSEKCPIHNILNDVFMKVYINDREICRYSTTTRDFYYYERLHIDLDKYFGKSFSVNDDYFTIYDIVEDLSSDDISIEFWTSTKNSIKRAMNFDFVLTFECTEE